MLSYHMGELKLLKQLNWAMKGWCFDILDPEGCHESAIQHAISIIISLLSTCCLTPIFAPLFTPILINQELFEFICLCPEITLQNQGNDKKIQALNNDCPICMEPLRSNETELKPLVYCRFSCCNVFHGKCLKKAISTAKGMYHITARCPLWYVQFAYVFILLVFLSGFGEEILNWLIIAGE